MRVNPFDQKDESFIFTAETTPSVSTNLNESVEKNFKPNRRSRRS